LRSFFSFSIRFPSALLNLSFFATWQYWVQKVLKPYRNYNTEEFFDKLWPMKYATPTTIDELETLFEIVPPEKLRKHLTFMFFQYLSLTGKESLHPEFKELSENIYSLIHVL
jgi:hypothetical protein